MPNAFKNTKFFQFTENGVNLGRTVGLDLERILRFSYVYPKFHLSFSKINDLRIHMFIVEFS